MTHSPIKLKGIAGYNGRQNDVIYCPPLDKTVPSKLVVYFGGDVQDFKENMTSEKLGRRWETDPLSEKCLKWNLDTTASLLASRFPGSHVLVIRPARIEIRTFSCYDNFVPCNSCGAPDHTPTHYALQHLELLLKTVSCRLQGRQEIQEIEGTEWPEKAGVLELDKCPLTLVGFSKGCVVLNQMLYEFHFLKTLTPDDDTLGHFVSQITDMHWLDGGHPGEKNTWITSTCLLETLARLGIKVHIDVTPYQVRDERRQWIGNEQKLFSERLRAAGAQVTETLHFSNEQPDLLKHFQVLAVFSTHS